MARYREISKVSLYKYRPQGYNLGTPSRGPLDVIFGNPRPYGYVQRELSFPYIIPCKTCEPRGGGKFDHKAII